MPRSKVISPKLLAWQERQAHTSIDSLVRQYRFFYHKHEYFSEVKQKEYNPTKSIKQIEIETTTPPTHDAPSYLRLGGRFKPSIIQDCLQVRTLLEILANIGPAHPIKTYSSIEQESDAVDIWFDGKLPKADAQLKMPTINNNPLTGDDLYSESIIDSKPLMDDNLYPELINDQKLPTADVQLKIPIIDNKPRTGDDLYPELINNNKLPTVDDRLKNIILQMIRRTADQEYQNRNSRVAVIEDLPQVCAHDSPLVHPAPELSQGSRLADLEKKPILQREEDQESLETNCLNIKQQYTWLEPWISWIRSFTKRAVGLCIKRITSEPDVSFSKHAVSLNKDLSPKPLSTNISIQKQDLARSLYTKPPTPKDYVLKKNRIRRVLPPVLPPVPLPAPLPAPLDTPSPKVSVPKSIEFNRLLTSPLLVRRLFETKATPSKHTTSSSWRTAVVFDIELGQTLQAKFSPGGQKGCRQVGMIDFLNAETLIDESYWGRTGDYLDQSGVRELVEKELAMLRVEASMENIKFYSEIYLKYKLLHQIWKFVGPETIVITFAGVNDMSFLGWVHDKTIDIRRLFAGDASLRDYANRTHISDIFSSTRHDAIEDCHATRELAIGAVTEVIRYIMEKGAKCKDVQLDLKILSESNLCNPTLRTNFKHFVQGAFLHIRQASNASNKSELLSKSCTDSIKFNTIELDEIPAGVAHPLAHHPEFQRCERKLDKKRSDIPQAVIRRLKMRRERLWQQFRDMQNAIDAGTPLSDSQKAFQRLTTKVKETAPMRPTTGLTQYEKVEINEHENGSKTSDNIILIENKIPEGPRQILMPSLQHDERRIIKEHITRTLKRVRSSRKKSKYESPEEIVVTIDGSKTSIMISKLIRFWIEANKLLLDCPMIKLQDVSEYNRFIGREWINIGRSNRDLMRLIVNIVWTWRLQGYEYYLDKRYPRSLHYRSEAGIQSFHQNDKDFLTGVPPHLSNKSQTSKISDVNLIPGANSQNEYNGHSKDLEAKVLDTTADQATKAKDMLNKVTSDLSKLLQADSHEQYIRRYIEETITIPNSLTTSQEDVEKFEPKLTQVSTDDGLWEVEIRPIELYYMRQNQLPLKMYRLLTQPESNECLTRAFQYCAPNLQVKGRVEFLLTNLMWIWRLQGFVYSISVYQSQQIVFQCEVTTQGVFEERSRQVFHVNDVDLVSGMPPHLMTKVQKTRASDKDTASTQSTKAPTLEMQQSNRDQAQEVSPKGSAHDTFFDSKPGGEEKKSTDKEIFDSEQDEPSGSSLESCPLPKILKPAGTEKTSCEGESVPADGHDLERSESYKIPLKDESFIDTIPTLSQDSEQSGTIENMRYSLERNDSYDSSKISWFANSKDDPGLQPGLTTYDDHDDHKKPSEIDASLNDNTQPSIPRIFFPIPRRMTPFSVLRSCLFMNPHEIWKFDLTDTIDHRPLLRLWSKQRIDLRLGYKGGAPPRSLEYKILPRPTHCLPRKTREGLPLKKQFPPRSALNKAKSKIYDPQKHLSWCYGSYVNDCGHAIDYFFDRKLSQFQIKPLLPYDLPIIDTHPSVDSNRIGFGMKEPNKSAKNHTVQPVNRHQSKGTAIAAHQFGDLKKNGQGDSKNDKKSHKPQAPTPVNRDLKVEKKMDRTITIVKVEKKPQSKGSLQQGATAKVKKLVIQKVKNETKNETKQISRHSGTHFIDESFPGCHRLILKLSRHVLGPLQQSEVKNVEDAKQKMKEEHVGCQEKFVLTKSMKNAMRRRARKRKDREEEEENLSRIEKLLE